MWGGVRGPLLAHDVLALGCQLLFLEEELRIRVARAPLDVALLAYLRPPTHPTAKAHFVKPSRFEGIQEVSTYVLPKSVRKKAKACYLCSCGGGVAVVTPWVAPPPLKWANSPPNNDLIASYGRKI